MPYAVYYIMYSDAEVSKVNNVAELYLPFELNQKKSCLKMNVHNVFA